MKVKFKYTVTNPDGDVYFRANDRKACEEYIEYWQSATGHDEPSSRLQVVDSAHGVTRATEKRIVVGRL